MATILNDAAYMALPMNIKRGNPIPLDTTAVWYDKTELETYAASGATAYVGQILTLYAGNKCEAYMISNEAGTLVKLAQTTASGDLASDVTNLQTEVNDLISKIGEAAGTDTEATGLYKEIADVLTIANKGVSDAATAKSAADAAQADVDALEGIVGADDTAGLRKRIATNEKAISTLQGLDTSKSARNIAAEEVAKIVANADADFDTLKEIADWISGHKTDATAMNTAITKLEGIVDGIGGEGEKATVVAYVTDAIAALKIGDYAKAADLTALASRVNTLEKAPAASITADDIAAWNAKQDAGNYITKATYDAKVTELETADSNNSTAIAAVKATAEAAVPKNAGAKSGTGIKVTTDSNGLVTGLAGLTKVDIPTIDQDQVDGLTTALGGKQDNITFNTAYDKATNKAATMSDVEAAKNAVVGTADDESTVDTIKATKKYADEQVTEALKTAKAYADGLVTGDSGVTARVEALEKKHAANKTVAQEVSDGIDALKLSDTYASKTVVENHIADTTAHITATERTNWNGAVSGVATLNGAETVAGSVKNIAKSYADGKDAAIAAAKSAADAANTLAGTKTTMADVEAKGYATKTEAQGYADAKDDAIAAAKKAGTDAQSAVNTLSGKVGTVPANKTVVQMISEAQTAATYDDTAVKASIKSVTDTVDAFLNSADTSQNAIDTLKEIQDYIDTHGKAAATLTTKVGALETTVGDSKSGLVKSVADNTAAITANLQAAKDYADEKVSALNIDDYAKDSDLTDHTGNTTVHITADERTKWNGAATNSHTHANKAELDKIASGDKAKWDAAQANVIESIKVEGATADLAISSKKVTLPLATATAAGLVKADESSLSVKNGAMSIKAVNVSTLYIAEGDELILNGGNA